jgi:hypothetical protein|tara:strand:- start:501 stop:794 length:294 start_codon:yes stop_codon:yes gene_type:complete
MKRYSGKPRGRVNLGGATHQKDRDKLKKLGKNYNSIDFELSDRITEGNYKDRSQPIGTLIVGNQRVDLTWSECNKVFTTLMDAQNSHKRKIQLGLFQ